MVTQYNILELGMNNSSKYIFHPENYNYCFHIMFFQYHCSYLVFYLLNNSLNKLLLFINTQFMK